MGSMSTSMTGGGLRSIELSLGLPAQASLRKKAALVDETDRLESRTACCIGHEAGHVRHHPKQERAMSDKLEMMASAIERKPHSFQFIRKATGLRLSDQEFTAMAKSDPIRFKLVRFLKRDDEGARIRPGLL